MAYTEPQNLTGIEGIFTYANSVTDSIFGIGILITLYLVVLSHLLTKGEEVQGAAMVAGYLTAITSIILFLAGMVTGLAVFISIMSVIIPVLWGYWGRS